MKLARFLLCLAAGLTGCSFLLAADPKPPGTVFGYTVTVDVQVDEHGVPTAASIHDSDDTTTGSVVSKMALAMALKTSLPPRGKDGKAEPYTARVPFFFPIEGDEGPASNRAPKPRPKPDVCVQPNYPQAMIDRGEVGGAIFELVVDAQGNLARLTTLRASHPEFEQAARQALATWKFAPASQDGTPVESRWRIAVVFDLGSKMADLKWRVAPRPSLGSFLVVHDDSPAPAPVAPAPAAGK